MTETFVRPHKPLEGDWTIKLMEKNGLTINTWTFRDKDQAEKAYEGSIVRGTRKTIETSLNEFEYYYGSVKDSKKKVTQ